MKRSECKIRWNEIRKELAALGYYAPPIFLDRWMRYRLIVVAVNHLADALQRDPHRVYMALLCRAERSRLGSPYSAYRQAKPPAGAPLEGERRRIAVVCPFCHRDLLDAGPVTEAEVKAQFQANQAVYCTHLPQDLPQSAESEREASRCEREAGMRQGEGVPPSTPGGAGGPGPDGTVGNVIKPDPPECEKKDL